MGVGNWRVVKEAVPIGWAVSVTNGKSLKSFLCTQIWGMMAFFFPVKDEMCRGDHL